jgi:hypothetical protein
VTDSEFLKFVANSLKFTTLLSAEEIERLQKMAEVMKVVEESRADHPGDPGSMQENMDRVINTIADDVREFCRIRLKTDPYFHIEDLRQYIVDIHPEMAPQSPQRALQWLRVHEYLDYACLDRRSSYYVVYWVDKRPEGWIRPKGGVPFGPTSYEGDMNEWTN